MSRSQAKTRELLVGQPGPTGAEKPAPAARVAPFAQMGRSLNNSSFDHDAVFHAAVVNTRRSASQPAISSCVTTSIMPELTSRQANRFKISGYSTCPVPGRRDDSAGRRGHGRDRRCALKPRRSGEEPDLLTCGTWAHSPGRRDADGARRAQSGSRLTAVRGYGRCWPAGTRCWWSTPWSLHATASVVRCRGPRATPQTRTCSRTWCAPTATSCGRWPGTLTWPRRSRSSPGRTRP